MEDRDATGNAALTVAIRPAGPGDRRFVEWLAGEAFARFGDYERILGEMFERAEVRTVVAETGARPVGFAMVDLAGRPLGEAYLAAIAVDPDRRGKRVGRALLAAAEEVARNPGPDGTARYMILETAVDNEGAIRFFRRAGFAPLARYTGRYPAGQPSVAMVKRLRPMR